MYCNHLLAAVFHLQSLFIWTICPFTFLSMIRCCTSKKNIFLNENFLVVIRKYILSSSFRQVRNDSFFIILQQIFWQLVACICGNFVYVLNSLCIKMLFWLQGCSLMGSLIITLFFWSVHWSVGSGDGMVIEYPRDCSLFLYDFLHEVRAPKVQKWRCHFEKKSWGSKIWIYPHFWGLLNDFCPCLWIQCLKISEISYFS